MVKLTVQFELSDDWDSFDKFYTDKDLRDKCLIDELLYNIKFENDIYNPDRVDSVIAPIKVVNYEINTL